MQKQIIEKKKRKKEENSVSVVAPVFAKMKWKFNLDFVEIEDMESGPYTTCLQINNQKKKYIEETNPGK